MSTTTDSDAANSTEPDKTISAELCLPTADVAFISSSNTVFKLLSSNVTTETCAGLAQLVAESLDVSDPIRLTEDSKVLELLFQFIDPPSTSTSTSSSSDEQPQPPSVGDIKPTLFFAVAEAAEKYGVSSAISACHARMESLLRTHPFEILNHSTLHDNHELADKAAYEALGCPLSQAALKLTAPGLLARYVTYYDSWLTVTHTITSLFYSRAHPLCPRSASFYHCIAHLLHEETPRMVENVTFIMNSVSWAMDCMKMDCLGDLDGKSEMRRERRWERERRRERRMERERRREQEQELGRDGSGDDGSGEDEDDDEDDDDEGEEACPCDINYEWLDEMAKGEVEGMGRFGEVRVERNE
ncbi:hypothetical protein BDN70DRAFT_997984 [Pholiota conissans]|uniref:BTB domain-containing protein n=1 Tax=Pholiota conissans TaxID=109636 RepID=A0A9P6CMX0_9AGAR|nr:hypothetical protein BDN70DRAFT_997984 [Pholiota conissans]